MARYPHARWRGPVPNQTPGRIVRPILGLILHIEQGSETGSDSWFHNPGAQASAHFGNPFTGPLDQWVDTNDKAWAEAAGNPRWISVEHEGYAGKAPAPTPTQIENDAQLLAWLHLTEGVPLQVTDSPTRPGLGWHGMGGQAWGGHLQCPGDRIKNARTAIVARAKQIVAPPKPPKPAPAPHPKPVPVVEGEAVKVKVIRIKGTAPQFVTNGIQRRWITSWDERSDLLAAGVIDTEVHDLPASTVNAIPLVGTQPH